ncbi:hypothetical protein SDC9_46862 [bioreactor metagenome]|uniref:NAD(+)--protein-arginine ADP-ribosyltransferase n=1 Tax=bioreactor metagenome TaxID=1076179 RepID=A0A644WE83_9ZZZZ
MTGKKLAQQYSYTCPHCGGFKNAVTPDLKGVSKEFDRLANQLRDGAITADDMPVQLSNAIAAEFMSGVDPVLKDMPDEAMVWMLRNNIYSFSAAKSFQELQELSAILLDGDKLRSLADFKRKAMQLHNEYNLNYMTTEYNFAIASAQNSARWWEFRENEEAMPMLRYQTVGDSRVRDSHKVLDGVTRNIRDSFWATHYPPNGWGCRCEAIQVSSAEHETYQVPKVGIPKPINTNLAHNGIIFPDASPYYSGITDDAILMMRPAFQNALKPAAKLLDLNPDFTHTELVCMYNYTDHDYLYLNPLMREGLSNRFVKEYTRQMTSALNRLPKYKGTSFRGFATESPVAFTEGKIITYKEFVSSSTDPETSEDYITRQDLPFKYFLKISGKSGRYIDDISAAGKNFKSTENENEVLFNANTSFKVIRIEKILDYTVIEMEEL